MLGASSVRTVGLTTAVFGIVLGDCTAGSCFETQPPGGNIHEGLRLQGLVWNPRARTTTRPKPHS